MRLFLDIPADVNRSFLCHWLELRDIVQMDGAYQSHEIRQKWFDLLFANRFSWSPSKLNDKRKMAYISWLLSKKVLVDYIEIPCQLFENNLQIGQFLSGQVPYLRTIKYYGSANTSSEQSNAAHN
jgi:hypothetical protein